jgi:hypothetical protein
MCSTVVNILGHSTDAAYEFQLSLVEAKGVACFMEMLTRNDFVSAADLTTKQVTVSGHSNRKMEDSVVS